MEERGWGDRDPAAHLAGHSVLDAVLNWRGGTGTGTADHLHIVVLGKSLDTPPLPPELTVHAQHVVGAAGPRQSAMGLLGAAKKPMVVPNCVPVVFRRPLLVRDVTDRVTGMGMDMGPVPLGIQGRAARSAFGIARRANSNRSCAARFLGET